MLINLRGTNGSGKTTVMRALLNQTAAKPIYGDLGPRVPEAYGLAVPKCQKRVSVIGPYHGGACGGCDAILPFERVMTLLDKYQQKGHVIFEGLLISTFYGVVGEYMERFGEQSVFLFLDTPLSVCIERVKARRDASRTKRVFNDKLMKGKYAAIEKLKDKVVAGGMRAVTVSDSDAARKIVELLQCAP